MPYFGNHFLHVASFCLFLQNRLNTHLDEHFIQSNLHFIYFPDYQYGGGVEIIAQTRCYTTNYNKAEQLYRQGRYAEARRHYAAASACPDKPKQNNIAARISACDNAINKIRQRERAEQQRQEAERERIRKEQEAEQERIRKERERQEQERREREEAERRRKLEEMRQAEAAKQEFMDKYGRTFTANGVSFTMILVEGGTFTMGDNSNSDTAEHQVTLSDYYIGQTEVTQALWEAVMGDLPWMQDKNRGDNKPMEARWDEWQDFIDRLNELTGLKFRMPTEAEWEYAAMGGNRSRGYIYAGSNDLDEVAWCYENSGAHYAHYQPVATKKPNELYLYDMSGNAAEWVSDRAAPYSSAPQTNPTGPRRGTRRIVRGGWAIYSSTFAFCIKYRDSDREIFDRGLRLALSAE